MNTSTTALATFLALAGGSQAPSTLEETRVTMDKWIETQQIISKERKDWEQGKEILTGRLELVKNEIALLQGKIQEAQSSVAEVEKKRAELVAESDRIAATGATLTAAVTRLEGQIEPLLARTPESVKSRLEQLIQRVPEDPATTKVSAPERFQNVIGILNELTKANNEISVSYEVRELAGGKPSEVQVIYVGLGQAYYVSGGGEGGIGRPGAEGWTWQPSKAVAGDILMALEILQGKHTPAFVSLPVTLQ
jgi:hypothetical protein